MGTVLITKELEPDRLPSIMLPIKVCRAATIPALTRHPTTRRIIPPKSPWLMFLTRASTCHASRWPAVTHLTPALRTRPAAATRLPLRTA
jgi:hypothetical protein